MPPLEETIDKLSNELLALAPGPVAELRRMEIGGPGAPAYWRLAKECRFLDSNPDLWMRIVAIMAILTSKGKRRGNDRLHDPRRRLGVVLCDGADPGWPGDARGDAPRPFLSETRLARLFALPAGQRGEAIARIARMLATRRDPASGVNCVEIAALLLSPDNERNLQNIARDYYRRLDAAAFKTKAEETEE
jgi:CRISPR system Cascade subunit CasB